MRQEDDVFSDRVRPPAARPTDGASESLGFDARTAQTKQEFSAAFSLVYEAYRRNGYVGHHPERLVYYPWFGLPTTRTVIAVEPNDDVAGTLSIVGDGAAGLPLEATYFSEVHGLRYRHRKVAEVTSLAIRLANRSRSLKVFSALTRYLFQYCCWAEFDDLVIAIHPRQQRFYGRRFGFHSIGPCRTYTAVGGRLAVACRVDLHNLSQSMNQDIFDLHFREPIPEDRFRQPPMDPAYHSYFCRLSGLPAAGAPPGSSMARRRTA